MLIQAFNIVSAQKELKNHHFDLIVLDINLPDGNGLGFLSKFRQTSNIPIIVLTANDMELDIVTGLEMGANDYITKPFSLAVLRARVNAQLRNPTQTENAVLIIDEFMFDFENMKFSKNNQPIELSKTEQKLLKILVQNKGSTITREKLVDKIWADATDSADYYVDENALSVTVKRLRLKLSTDQQYIKTVYGIGYTWTVG